MKLKTACLNDGIGEAWAGHVKAKADPEPNEKEEIFETEENFGAAVPTGSKIGKLFFMFSVRCS